MGFTGVIVVTPAASRELLLETMEEHGEDEGFDELADGWLSSVFYGDEVANFDAEAASRELASRSGEPVLWCSVLDSDCAMLAAAGPAQAMWTGCLEREALIDITEAVTELSGRDGDIQRYLVPVEQALPGLITWAVSAGLHVDEQDAAAALRTTGAYVLDSVTQLLEALGLVSIEGRNREE